MHSTFNDVLWIVCSVGIVVALLSLIGSGKTWDEFGRRGLLMESDSQSRSGGRASSAGSQLERDTEIRQMLEARNTRRVRRGEAPVDVEAELRRLTAPIVDDELRGEIRDLVVARNHRRVRRGEAPLDVEAEVEREIANLATLER